MRLLHRGEQRTQEALHQEREERERGGGCGVARDRIRHRGHEGAGAVWGQQVQCQLKANLFTQHYTCQIIPLSAKRWNFNILYIFISIPEKVWPDLIFNDHTMPEHLSDLAICSRCGQTGSKKKCSQCHSITYCGEECQRQDLERHKDNCILVVLTETTGKGRGLVASRDIQIGQVILKEQSVVSVYDDERNWAQRSVAFEKSVRKVNEDPLCGTSEVELHL